MPEPDQNNKKNFGILNFFKNPYVGIFGSVASIIGVIIAIYFYSISNRYRELVYFIHPAKAIVVKTGQTSKLQYYFDDKEIKSDLTAAQIAIWNNGTESIKKDNILSQVNIITKPSVPILEATILKKSRSVIDITVDQSYIMSGTLPLTWNIFEKGDGIIIQVVYAGDVNNKLSIEGVIEGQAAIKEIKYVGSILSPTEQFSQHLSEQKILILILIGLLILLIILMSLARRIIKKYGSMESLVENRLFMISYYSLPIFIIIVIGIIANYYFNKITEPPFGF